MKRLPMVISEAFFFVLYIVIKTVVSVGEITQNIVTLLWKINFTVLNLQKLKNSFKKNDTKTHEHKENHEIQHEISLITKEKTLFIQKLKPLLHLYSQQAAEVLTTSKETIQKTVKKININKRASHFFKAVKKGTFFTIRKSIDILGFVVIPTVVTFFKNVKAFFQSVAKFFTSYRLGYFALGLLSCFILVFAWQSYEFVQQLPSPKNIGKLNYPVSTQITDRNGKPLYEIYRDHNRTPVRLHTLPKYIAQATIATEDKDFYTHHGISIVGGMLRAIKDTYISNELQGGSTITQQLVKSALLSPDRTIERKVKEIILAVWTENLYSKDQILEMYLNQVPYGGSAYGVEEASKTYFGKHASNLTLGEAALLAGLPRAPSLYSPYVNPERAKQRRNEVLNRMLTEHYITQDQYKAETSKPLAISPLKTNIQAPHFVFYTKQKLEEQFGPSVVEEGGLRVKTTLNLDVQHEAEKILKEEIAKVAYLNVTNGAVLVTKPATGEIVAMVGSVDYNASPSGAFNVVTGLRQPGSSIKPVMYSLALENGYTAASLIDDSPLVIANPGAEPYRPVNYDGRYHGQVSIRLSLANSFNIPAVKVLQTLGVQRFIYHAEKMGIDTWTDPSRYGLSITLGGAEVRMTDMAEAFGVFANKGNLTNLTNIKEIENQHGDTMEFDKTSTHQVMDPGVAYIISDILSDNQARVTAFGPGSQLEIPGYKASVKTGTTNELKDNWTIGYTPEYLVAVWVGNNDNTPMNPYLTSGITGAAPIWHRVMEYLLKKEGQPEKWFDKPSDIVERNCNGKPEYFINGTENSSYCRPTPAPFNGGAYTGPWPTWTPAPNQFYR
jgi:1A family penicillin-binding protein